MSHSPDDFFFRGFVGESIICFDWFRDLSASDRTRALRSLTAGPQVAPLGGTGGPRTGGPPWTSELQFRPCRRRQEWDVNVPKRDLLEKR